MTSFCEVNTLALIPMPRLSQAFSKITHSEEFLIKLKGNVDIGPEKVYLNLVMFWIVERLCPKGFDHKAT